MRLLSPFAFLALLSLLSLAPRVAGAPPASVDPTGERLEIELAGLAKRVGGVVGVAALHVETGRRVALNGGQSFPMGSTYKLPLALWVLTRVDRGEERLERRVSINPRDLRLGGTVVGRYSGVGFTLSVRELLETSIQDSDNTAADLLMRESGGPEAVTAYLRSQGIDGIRVDRSYARLVLDLNGIRALSPDQWSLERYRQQRDAVPAAEKLAALDRFEADPRDTATPEGMVGLLAKLEAGVLLRPETTALLLETMRGTRTGDARLRALLPKGVVADKTGTIGRSVNDVGLLTLPGDAGHVAVAVYMKGSDTPERVKEQAIAAMARAIYEHFRTPAADRPVDPDRASILEPVLLPVSSPVDPGPVPLVGFPSGRASGLEAPDAPPAESGR